MIIGQSGAAGANETDEAVNIVFSQIENAKFLCRCLYRWFLYYVIDDNIETVIIAQLANLVVQPILIVPVLSVFLQSETFYPMNVWFPDKEPG